MKRRLITLIALIMTVLIGCSSLMGCNLVTTDRDRDIEQVVATISIEEGFKDEIRKKDLLLSYMNYGHSYEEQGYTQAQAVETIIDQLVNSKILLQHAMIQFNGQVAPFDGVTLDDTKAITDPERYLTEEEIVDAIYSTRHSMEDFLESFEEHDEDKADSLVEDVRTIPTNATNAEEELTLQEKKDHNAKKFENEFSRKAFLSAVRVLDTNSLKGKDYDGTIESTEYYKQLLASSFESAVVEKFSNITTAEALKNFSFEDIENAYLNKYEAQKKWSNAEFAEALGTATASNPILYSAFGSYGYVYNLLLGVNDEQKTKIEDIDTKLSDAEKELERKEILKTTTVKDLRSTWVLSGYDFDGTNFTGDYSVVKNSANALPFLGTTTKLKDADHHSSAVYRVDSVNSYNLDEFISLMENYVYGSTKSSADVSSLSYKESVYKMVVSNDDVVDYDGKINELLFAFSTDSGSLNTYKGYAIKPAVDGNDTEEYVTTFAKAGRKLLEVGASNKSSYIMVASDFGYHIMFFSQIFTPDYSAGENLVDYLNNINGTSKSRNEWVSEFNAMLDGWQDWDDDKNYMFLLTNEIVSSSVNNALNKVQTDIVNKYWFGSEGKVVINADAYADIII